MTSLACQLCMSTQSLKVDSTSCKLKLLSSWAMTIQHFGCKPTASCAYRLVHVSGKCTSNVWPIGCLNAGPVSTGVSRTCSEAGASRRLSWLRSSKQAHELGTQFVLLFPGCASSSCSAEAGGAWLDGHKHLETSPLCFVCQPTQSFLQ